MPEALNDEITEELATKADLLALEAALKTEIAEARVDLGGEIAGLRAEVAAARGHLEAKAESVRTQIIKWVGGMLRSRSSRSSGSSAFCSSSERKR
ncbi:MAG TPA: hypothetical protein VFZ01_03855 [Geminicoccaceae bacterium]